MSGSGFHPIGDPRDARVDPVDWIEEIPFNETRNYVMRVLENTEVYRNRLAGRDQKLQILSDLYRPDAPQVEDTLFPACAGGEENNPPVPDAEARYEPCRHGAGDRFGVRCETGVTPHRRKPDAESLADVDI